ncbi:hypothetical protein LEL_10844 [Akanthomyces lecanii RCEF 1005]|uniref:Uncharacterized protein n=1 Tax=Akanthomyces lecanii RCEF 1005 TaxID=1081108 RepID=A0A167S4N7_CORDF|nr:hypothetical protein LEL_10844 [Akanthomyces lecanii RCEF 1005]
MAPQTRSQTAGNQPTKIRDQKTKQQENNSISKKKDSSKTSKNLEKTLTAAADAYDKADAGKKAEMQNQLNVHQPVEKPEAMEEDEEESEGEQPVKKEPEESGMFVSTTGEAQNHSPKNDRGSPSDQKPSSSKEKDSKPPSDNHEKSPPPKVGFQHGLATPSTDVEDELDLVRANPMREIFHDGASENVGWARLSYGRAFDVERHGPPNAARFRFKRRNDEINTDSLDDTSFGDKKRRNGRKVYQCGDIVSIQGVVWQSLKGVDHYSSLAPRNWKQGNKTARPSMRIMVKWEGKDENAGKEVTKWEKRDAVWRCWEDERGNGAATVLCEEELKLGGSVILEKGENVSLCDFVIVTAACRAEERFKEWESKQRPGRDRSPTPGLPLLNSKNDKQPAGEEGSDNAQSSQRTNNAEEAKSHADSTH